MPKSKKVVKQVKRAKPVKPVKQSKKMKSLKPSTDCKNECAKKYPLEPQFKKITDFYTEQMIQLKTLSDEAGAKNLFESNDAKMLETALPILHNLFTRFKKDMKTLKQFVGMKVYGQRMKCVLTSCMSDEQMTELKLAAFLFGDMQPKEIYTNVILKFVSIARLFLDLPSLQFNDIEEQTLQQLVVPKKGVEHLQQQCRIYGVLILHTLIKDLMPSCFKVLFPMLLANE